MTIELSPEIEERLRGEASRRGLEPAELAARLIAEQLPPVPGGGSPGDLFAQWAREDATDDPEELVRRNRDAEELKQALNRNRSEMEGPNARTPFP